MRIYVACLASYNAGKTHGRWIDATQGIDGIHDEVAAMLRESPEPNVSVRCLDCGPVLCRYADCSDQSVLAAPGEQVTCVHCRDALGLPALPPCSTCKDTGQVPSAEEYAIHDYEDFGPWKIGEYESLETVAAVAEAAESEGDAFLAWFDEHGAYFNQYGAEFLDVFRDEYQGTWKSQEDFAENFLEDLGEIQSIPAHLRYYFDYEAYARDLFINDYESVDAPNGVYVFRRG